VRIVFYRVESDRLLLVVEAENRGALKRGMQGFGIRLSKAMNRLMGTRGSIFSGVITSRSWSSRTRRAAQRGRARASKARQPRVSKLAEPKTRALRSALASGSVRRAAARYRQCVTRAEAAPGRNSRAGLNPLLWRAGNGQRRDQKPQTDPQLDLGTIERLLVGGTDGYGSGSSEYGGVVIAETRTPVESSRFGSPL
jgi:hypothetical protein